MRERENNNDDQYPEGDILAQAEFILRSNQQGDTTEFTVDNHAQPNERSSSSLIDVRNALQKTYESKYPNLAQPYLDFTRPGGLLTSEGESLSQDQLEELAIMSDEYGRVIRLYSGQGTNVMRRLNSYGNSEVHYLASQRLYLLKVFQLSREKIVEGIDYSFILGQIASDPPKLTLWEKLRNLSSEKQKSFFKSIVASRIGEDGYALPSDLSYSDSRGGELAEYLLLQQVQKNTAEKADQVVRGEI